MAVLSSCGVYKPTWLLSCAVTVRDIACYLEASFMQTIHSINRFR